jgi:hypothetical protein
MKKLLLPFILCLLLPGMLSGQRIYEFPRLRIGFEAGFENFFGSNIKPSAIREQQSHYHHSDDYYYDCGYLYNEPAFTRYYFGVKPEYSLNHNFAVAAGLRFSFGDNALVSDRNNFLWVISNSETASNMVRIKDINQKVYNIGIPLELKIYPNKSDIFARLYGKVGAVFNFAFAQDVSVSFADKSMNKYLPEIESHFEKPSLFNGQFILGFGMKFGRMKQPFGNIEMIIPIQFSAKTRLNSLFEMNDAVGIGVQTTLYIPAGKKKLSYTY